MVYIYIEGRHRLLMVSSSATKGKSHKDDAQRETDRERKGVRGSGEEVNPKWKPKQEVIYSRRHCLLFNF